MIREVVELRRASENRRLTRSEREAVREKKLRSVIHDAYDRVPYDRSLLGPAGVTSEDVRNNSDNEHQRVYTGGPALKIKVVGACHAHGPHSRVRQVQGLQQKGRFDPQRLEHRDMHRNFSRALVYRVIEIVEADGGSRCRVPDSDMGNPK